MPTRIPLLWAMASILLLSGVVTAEIYVPPKNVIDPAKAIRPVGEDFDRLVTDESLPFIYLEPHDFCFDITKPLTLTVCAVNRSGQAIKIDWRAIIEALSLEAVGPGAAKPIKMRWRPETADVGSWSVGTLTFDLKDLFEVRGASVYRLSYTRPMDDGRIHFTVPATFVVEDPAAIEKIAASLDAGLPRDTVPALLKSNPVFASGTRGKTWGADAFAWKDPEMHRVRGSEEHARAQLDWRKGVGRLTGKNAPAAHARAMEALYDRLLYLSDQFRQPPYQPVLEYMEVQTNVNLSAADRERIYLKLVRSRDRWIVSRSVSRLIEVESAAAVDVFIAFADGPDKDFAREVISRLTYYRPTPEITQFLRRKMTDADGELALEAAIVTCASGDWLGMPVVLRCAGGKDPDLRLRAIAHLGAPRYRSIANKVVPLLLAELEKPTSDEHLERAIGSLDAYPTEQVVKAVTPFLKHKNSQVSTRARLTLATIESDRSRDNVKQ